MNARERRPATGAPTSRATADTRGPGASTEDATNASQKPQTLERCARTAPGRRVHRQPDLLRPGDLRGGAREDLEEELDRGMPRIGDPGALRLPHHHHRAGAGDRGAGAGRRSARVPQRLPPPGQHHREPSLRQLQGRDRVRSAEAHDVHVSRLAVRHEGQLCAHLAREGGLPEPALTHRRGAAPPALRGLVRRVRVGDPRRLHRQVGRGMGGRLLRLPEGSRGGGAA